MRKYIEVKILDFFWWLANSKYEWWANIFYPLYCSVADKLIN